MEAGFTRYLVLLELFPVVLAMELWGETCWELKLRLNCDNMGVVQVINCMSAPSPPIRLLRRLVLRCLRLNIFIYAVHIPGVDNVLADALSFSVGQVQRAGPGRREGRPAMPCLDLGAGFGVTGWIWQSVSEATWAYYNNVWKEWSLLVREAGIGNDRAEVRLLVLYFVSPNMESGGSVSAIEQKMAGLSFLFKLLGGEDATKDFWVKQALKGFKKGHKKLDSTLSVTFANLRTICGGLWEVCTSSLRYFCLRQCSHWHFMGRSG